MFDGMEQPGFAFAFTESLCSEHFCLFKAVDVTPYFKYCIELLKNPVLLGSNSSINISMLTKELYLKLHEPSVPKVVARFTRNWNRVWLRLDMAINCLT